MRRLLLLRHAKSDRPPGMPDHDRPLNRRGRDDAPIIGTYLAHNALIPDRVLCSTAERTRETWDLVAGQLPKHPPVEFEERLYEAGSPAILNLVRATPQKAHSLLVIGHNPGMHQCALTLIASGDVEARERLHEKFPTTALAVIDFALDDWDKLHARSGRLDRFITPRQLSAEPD
jgi:phosphohistidine phosphatase